MEEEEEEEDSLKLVQMKSDSQGRERKEERIKRRPSTGSMEKKTTMMKKSPDIFTLHQMGALSKRRRGPHTIPHQHFSATFITFIFKFKPKTTVVSLLMFR